MADCNGCCILWNSRDNPATINMKTITEVKTLRDSNPSDDDYKYWVKVTCMTLD